MFSTILVIHILFGVVALAVAPGAMITVKGGLWHRRWGKIYFWSMLAVAVTATVLCWLRSGIFLFLIAIFSFYLALSGYRALARKTPAQRPALIDWAATGGMLVAGVWLILRAAMNMSDSKALVEILFGLIGLLLAYLDIVSFLKPPVDKRAWMYNHLTRFLAAYVATVTAFSVVNLRLPWMLQWWWPTVVGVTAITVCRRHYMRKFKRQPLPSA